MALAASHHGLLPVAPAATLTPTPSRGHLLFRAARPLPRPARRICCQSINSANALGASSTTSDEAVPVPVVQIDQDSDRDATIVQLSFGDRLGALLDTMKALKDLGLDVTKGSVTTDSAVTQTKFHIMRLWVLAPSCFIFVCSI
ncbi:unnamed protein product [Miscanthus lutarioriparius]|uniref:ACT domain-containing protein ACR n=1 Tax=Miscanthus lutarioriparius TaxID=422564 RepID=A0A811REL6_9POAL|nr:unnamed protein product [Miscanthus lutarioriparius]